MKSEQDISAMGTERDLKRARFARWQAAHKELLQTDAGYRRRFTTYLVQVTLLSCLLLPVYGIYFGFGLVGIATSLVATFVVAALIVFLAVRQMLYQKGCISRYWQTHS